MSSDASSDGVAAAPTFAVLDIDGVLADVRHRLHHLERRPKNWKAFFAAAAQDPPLPEGLELANLLAAEHVLVYLTGRPANLRSATEAWLRQHGLPPGRLLMRGVHDHRPARTTKIELLRRLEADHPVHVIVDDDAEVIAAAQEAGFAALHATWAETRAVLRQAQEHEGRT